MSYVSDQKPAPPVAPVDLSENTGAGPLAPATAKPTFSYSPPNMSMRSRLERVGYWIMVVAALAVLLALVGVFLPRFVGGMITGFYIGVFVGLLTLLNLSRPAGWGNALLGRRIFPVLRAPDSALW